jgi:hypothetical protein
LLLFVCACVLCISRCLLCRNIAIYEEKGALLDV